MRRYQTVAPVVGVVALALLATGCGLIGGARPSVPPWTPRTAPSDPVVLAAGDIVTCGDDQHELTAAIVDEHPDAIVATLGDTVYERGSPREFKECYDPSWGRFNNRIRPSVGGHEYLTPDARGYFSYFADVLGRFGPAATDPKRGWYSYRLGDWHVVVLNSICREVDGGCEPRSPQLLWLEEELESMGSLCTLAYWHTPRFSSGRKANRDSLEPLWDVLYEHGAEVVLSGDNHVYERFAPQDPDGTADSKRGVRAFVVGTGGRELYPFTQGVIEPNSEARNDHTHGLLKLVLKPRGYEWQFLAEQGRTYTDSGSGGCH